MMDCIYIGNEKVLRSASDDTDFFFIFKKEKLYTSFG